MRYNFVFKNKKRVNIFFYVLKDFVFIYMLIYYSDDIIIMDFYNNGRFLFSKNNIL